MTGSQERRRMDRIVRSAVIGVERDTVGGRHLKYENGLTFAKVREDQEAAIASIMEALAHRAEDARNRVSP